MKSIVAIRTNKWSTEEERLLASLRLVQGMDVVVVFHNRPDGLDIPADVVDIDNKWIEARGLRYTHDWGWRCGDYFYYALRSAKPNFDYYWLVEPDVLFSGNPDGFFKAYETATEDLLGVRIDDCSASHPYASTLTGMKLCRAIFALTRFSGKALDILLPLRVEISKIPCPGRNVANDEMFTFSNVQNHPELTLGTLTDRAPQWFEGAYVDTDPDILIDAILNDPTKAGKVFHPVCGREPFKAAVAGRLSATTGFLGRMCESLACLDDEDFIDISQYAADNLLKRLHQFKVD